MRFLLLQFSTPVLLLLIVGGSVFLTVLATYVVRQRMPESAHVANNEVAGYLFAAVAVVYGVLLAFVVLVVWQEFETSQEVVQHEANSVVDVYRVAQELPEPYGAQLRAATKDYTEKVINLEWPQMQTGEQSPDAAGALQQLWTLHRELDRQGVELHGDALFTLLNGLGDQRRIRILNSDSQLPTMMWVLLWGGATVTLAFTLFFRTPNLRAHLLMAGMFAGLLAFIIFLIIELDSPFTGEVGVQPLAFQQSLQTIRNMEK